ncbi:sporozoite surface antigen MB2, putative [Plasmodium malariae]|uniref:Translation initiation factor IF-2, chloroplastic n=1 Tax=Plasmodium malariae TaxID=5858 RepID=A0A1D3RIK4_PLAMA|nr:sporozoite surface antigen MB2, putative [Plasmodium malariae]SCN44857.1 sporozoite surface antigen MB2, putative [Plasmodium malariae]
MFLYMPSILLLIYVTIIAQINLICSYKLKQSKSNILFLKNYGQTEQDGNIFQDKNFRRIILLRRCNSNLNYANGMTKEATGLYKLCHLKQNLKHTFISDVSTQGEFCWKAVNQEKKKEKKKNEKNEKRIPLFLYPFNFFQKGDNILKRRCTYIRSNKIFARQHRESVIKCLEDFRKEHKSGGKAISEHEHNQQNTKDEYVEVLHSCESIKERNNIKIQDYEGLNKWKHRKNYSFKKVIAEGNKQYLNASDHLKDQIQVHDGNVYTPIPNISKMLDMSQTPRTGSSSEGSNKKKKSEEDPTLDGSGIRGDRGNINYKDSFSSGNINNMHNDDNVKDKYSGTNTTNRSKYTARKIPSNFDGYGNGSSLNEKNIGKTFEGRVHSVSRNVICVQIANINAYGLLFINKANLGNDVDDMNSYFKLNQKVFVKILGINFKKYMYYLANVIKFNEDIKLAKWDCSKGMITKICEAYCFVKVLKNGSTGYLHKSKLFLQRKDSKGDYGNISLECTSNNVELRKNCAHNEWEERHIAPFIDFTKIFKIWDIIDVQILGESDGAYKSNYVLSIPVESNTFEKVVNYIKTLDKDKPKVTSSFGTSSIDGSDIYTVDEYTNSQSLFSSNRNPIYGDSKEKNNANINGVSRHIADRYITNHTNIRVSYKKENKRANNSQYNYPKKSKESSSYCNNVLNKITKPCDLTENIKLSMFSKITKISTSSLKRFFIINESRELNPSYVLNYEQIKKACEHFNINYNIIPQTTSTELSVRNCSNINTDEVNATCVDKLEQEVNHKVLISQGEVDRNIHKQGKETNDGEVEVVRERNTPFVEEQIHENGTGEVEASLVGEAATKAKKKKKGKTANLLPVSGGNWKAEMEKQNLEGTKRNIVITFIGHINHGKTSLFDYICKTNERNKEFGLITQNIRAFKAKVKEGYSFTLIDTPGHEAFMSIRSRGVKVSDLSVLVISGEEGIQEQTVECIKLIKEYNIKIIIAITKVDLANASVERIVNDLMYYDIYTELNGGEIQLIQCSIYNDESINKLLDSIYLESEFMDLDVNNKEQTEGIILDSYMDKNGIVSINLLQKGILKINDYFYTGSSYGKVKILKDHLNKNIKYAYPSDPIKVMGYKKNSIPVAGDKFYVVKNESIAQSIAEHNKNEILTSYMYNSNDETTDVFDKYKKFIISNENEQEKNANTFVDGDDEEEDDDDDEVDDEEPNTTSSKRDSTNREGGRRTKNVDRPSDIHGVNDTNEDKEISSTERSTMNKQTRGITPSLSNSADGPHSDCTNETEDNSDNIDEKGLKTIYVKYFIKCDKQGTIDVLKNSLTKLEREDTIFKVKNKVIYANIGDITSSDIVYALSFNAVIIGFNVKLEKNFKKNSKNAKNSNYRIIFSNVLYELVEKVKEEMGNKLSTKPSGQFKGRAKILKVFNISKLGKVAGCIVTCGTISNNSNVRILRGDKVIYVGKIVSLKIVKEEKTQVTEGEECGMGFNNFVDFDPYDVIESYEE